jgi:anti-sigma B factor antagonist
MARKTTKQPPLQLEGALDVQNASNLHAALSDRVTLGAALVSLDLSGVTACDTAGLQLLCAARRSVLASGREWQLLNPSAPVIRACEETALSREEIGL